MKTLIIKELEVIGTNQNEKWHDVVLKEVENNTYKLVKAHIEVLT